MQHPVDSSTQSKSKRTPPPLFLSRLSTGFNKQCCSLGSSSQCILTKTSFAHFCRLQVERDDITDKLVRLATHGSKDEAAERALMDQELKKYDETLSVCIRAFGEVGRFGGCIVGDRTMVSLYALHAP